MCGSARALALIAVILALPPEAEAQERRRPIPSDSLSAKELVAEWERDRIEAPPEAHSSPRDAGVQRALRHYRSNPARADSVRDELERVALGAAPSRVRATAVGQMISGYKLQIPDDRAAEADSRALALRLERIYHTTDDRRVKTAVMSATAGIGGSGRAHALNWLEPLIIQETHEQSFPWEALAAMRAAGRLGPPGLALIVRLREAGLIKDPEARFWSAFARIGGSE